MLNPMKIQFLSFPRISGLFTLFIFTLFNTALLFGQSVYEVNINCGGPEYTTSSGVKFSADSLFNNGAVFINTVDPVAGTTDDTIYQYERYHDNLSYSFAVPVSGVYEVTLHFAEVYFKNQDTNKRVFDVNLEGNLVLDDYDIYASVGGYTADVKTFMVNVTDGELNLDCTSSVNKAKLCGIQVKYNPPVCNDSNHVATVDTVSETICSTDSLMAGGAYQNTTGFYTDTLLNKNACDSIVITDLFVTTCTSPAFDLSINCGGLDYTASNGQFFHEDSLFLNGTTFSKMNQAIAGTNEDFIFQSERYDANLGYEIPVPVNGNYDVTLYFAEIFNKNFDTNKRVFDILLEGNLVLDDYDIYADVGANTAATKTFTVNVQDLGLSLSSTSSINNAKLCAIRVVSTAVDCQMGPWSAWSACDVSCGGGTQYRTRQILVPASNGGIPCLPTIEYRACNTHICVVSENCPNDTVVYADDQLCSSMVHYSLDSSGINTGHASASFASVPMNLTDCPKNQTYAVSDMSLAPAGVAGSALGTDVNLESVWLKIDHRRVSDLVIDLHSPNGSVVRLVERPGITGLSGSGGCSRDHINALFVTGTGNSAENDCSGNPVLSGSYTAHDGYDLDNINDGSDPNGQWTLKVYDYKRKKKAKLRGWALHFKTGNGSIVQIAGLPSGATFPLGVTTNTMVFTDSLGTVDTCSFTVTVEDTISPVFDHCGVDLYTCGDPATWATPTATDNCGSVNVVQTGGPTPGSSFADGTYLVSYMATDASGNTTSCNFNLVKGPLSVDAGNDRTIYAGSLSSCVLIYATAQNGQAPYSYSWSNGASNRGTIVCPSTTTDYIVTVTDANGCTGTDTVTVEVVDVSCSNNKVLICYNGTTYCTNSWVAWYYTSFKGASYGACPASTATKMGSAANLPISFVENEEVSQELLQAYPNPFADVTSIEWSFEQAESVEIGLFDLTGRKVMDIYNGTNLPGEIQSTEFSAADLPAGMYMLIAKTPYSTKTVRVLHK